MGVGVGVGVFVGVSVGVGVGVGVFVGVAVGVTVGVQLHDTLTGLVPPEKLKEPLVQLLLGIVIFTACD